MNKYLKNNRQKGTTIVELLIYMALLVIFLTVLLDVFVTTLGFKLQSESTSTLNQDSRYIFEKLSYDIYNSDGFTVPSSGQLNFTYNGLSVTYVVSDGDLLRNSVKLNSLDTRVQSITFGKIDETVKVVLTLESRIDTPGEINTQSFETTLAPR